MELVRDFNAPTIYLISDNEVPSLDQLPWSDEQCDAFVAILESAHLTHELARDIASGLVGVRTDWIETMGNGAEFLHDLIDRCSKCRNW